MTPEERYDRDPMFNSLVTVMEHYIERMELTPTEMREAAVLACYRYEMRREPRPICYTNIRGRLIEAELERSDE